VLSLQSEYPFTNRIGVGYQEDQLELGLMQGGSAFLGGAEKLSVTRKSSSADFFEL
jgi:hypothetical protein